MFEIIRVLYTTLSSPLIAKSSHRIRDKLKKAQRIYLIVLVKGLYYRLNINFPTKSDYGQ